MISIFPAELEATQTDRRAAIEVLRKRFVLLWDRLAFDEDEKRQILEENNTCKLSVVDNFKKQVLKWGMWTNKGRLLC